MALGTQNWTTFSKIHAPKKILSGTLTRIAPLASGLNFCHLLAEQHQAVHANCRKASHLVKVYGFRAVHDCSASAPATVSRFCAQEVSRQGSFQDERAQGKF